MPHGSIIESPKLEAQTGTENLRHILVVDDDPMVCMVVLDVDRVLELETKVQIAA